MKTRSIHNLLQAILLFALAKSASAQSVVTVTPAEKHQVMLGWGVSLCWWANLVGGMSPKMIDSIAKLAAVDLHLNVFRFNIGGGENPGCTSGKHMRADGGNMPGYREQYAAGKGWGTCNLANDARQIAVMDKLANYGAGVITETFSNSPPWWMTKSGCASGNTDGSENLAPAFVLDFGDYLATVTAELNKKYPRWNIACIEPFNEPLSNWWRKGGSQEGCFFSTASQAEVLSKVKQQRAVYGIGSTGLAAADANSVPETRSGMVEMAANNPAIYKDLAAIHAHSYSGTWQEKAALRTFAKNNGDKPVWQSETGPLGWTPSDGKSWWQGHFMIAYRVIEDIRNLECPVWCDWQFMSVDEGWGMLHQTNFSATKPFQDAVFTITRGFYCRKNVTEFIKPGYQIIGTNDGNTMAAQSPDSLTVVVVIANQNSVSKNYTIDMSQVKNIRGFKTVRTSGDYTSTENCTELTKDTITAKGTLANGRISYCAPAFSVTAFIISRETATAVSDIRLQCKHLSVVPQPRLARSFFKASGKSDYVPAGLFSLYRIIDPIGRTVGPGACGTNKVIGFKWGLSNGVYLLEKK